MKSLAKFGFYLAWWWCKHTPTIFFAWFGFWPSEYEQESMQADLGRLHELEIAVESEYPDA